MLLLNQFLEMMVTKRGATRSTLSACETDLRNFYAFLKDQKVNYLTFQDIQDYLLTQKHLSLYSVRRGFSYFRRL